jgi:hypothetical protein
MSPQPAIFLIGLLVLGHAAAAATAASDAGADARVACQLPPQIRQLGRNATYLAAGRIVQTTAADCRVRGGKAKPLPATAAAPAPLPATDGKAMAIMVGGDRKTAACPVSGRIVGLKAGSTLSVRTGPGTGYARIDRLDNERAVFVCDGSSDQAWLGVVYPTSAGQDCGVSRPITDAAAYAGPCQQGWVSAGWVRTGD